MAYKYIIIKSGPYRFPIIFPDKLVHSDVATALIKGQTIPRIKKRKPTIESAGEIVGLDIEGVEGRSSTLQLDSHREDRKIINTLPYLHGIGFKDD